MIKRYIPQDTIEQINLREIKTFSYRQYDSCTGYVGEARRMHFLIVEANRRSNGKNITHLFFTTINNIYLGDSPISRQENFLYPYFLQAVKRDNKIRIKDLEVKIKTALRYG